MAVRKNEQNTIAALSTPPGTGGIACVRISGDKAFEIASHVFNSKKPFNEIPSHSVTYGRVVNGQGETLDEVLLLKMKGPRTYTKEDVVEIHCHGGPVVTSSILALLYKSGAEPAEPGEFTKRAFLNGRLDLTQAEAVMDIINSKTAKSEKSAAIQLEGKTGKQVSEIRESIIGLLSEIGLSIDYPEYEDEAVSVGQAVEKAIEIKEKTEKLIENFDTGKILREGLNVAVIGPPNAGKSTFINKITGEEKAIVTHIPGTTRDVLEIQFSIKGFPVVLHDTAGIRKTDDLIEKLGIEKTMLAKDKSEILIAVLDASRGLDGETRNIIENSPSGKTVFAINKTDAASGEEIKESLGEGARVVECSFISEKGIDEIIENLYDMMGSGSHDVKDITVTNERHKMHIDKALEALKSAIETGGSLGVLDLMSVELTDAADQLGMITGENAGEDVINLIFSRFCVGK